MYKKLPTTALSGFPGAGKTTLLKYDPVIGKHVLYRETKA
jgi:predicted ATPase